MLADTASCTFDCNTAPRVLFVSPPIRGTRAGEGRPMCCTGMIGSGCAVLCSASIRSADEPHSCCQSQQQNLSMSTGIVAALGLQLRSQETLYFLRGAHGVRDHLPSELLLYSIYFHAKQLLATIFQSRCRTDEQNLVCRS